MTEEAILDSQPLADPMGTSSTLADQAHIRTLKICLTGAVVVIVILGLSVVFAASRPPYVSIIRMDTIRGAELIRMPSQVAAGLKSADARGFLWDWCLLRYRILKGDAEENLERSRLSMSTALAQKYRASDAKRVAEVLAGVRPEQTADQKLISISPLKYEVLHGNKVAVGHALIEFMTRENLQVTAEEDEASKRAWRVDIDFYMDPVGFAQRAADGCLLCQIYDPLGVVITNYWDTEITMSQASEGAK